MRDNRFGHRDPIGIIVAHFEFAVPLLPGNAALETSRNPMNYSRKLIYLLGLGALTGCVPSYARVEYGDYYGRRYVDLYDYSPGYYGDWRSYYSRWSPVVIYEYRGRYYPYRFRGGRALQVYRNGSGYFLPPRDRDWNRTDRRFDRRPRPNSSDYRRALRPRR
jgi:hypothetical protein